MQENTATNQSPKKHFLLKTFPPRLTFQQDMTEAELDIMKLHIAYWTGLLNRGIAHVFGPVFDSEGGYGIGIIEAESEAEVHILIADDPAVKSQLLRTEFYPMQAVMRK